MKRQILSITVVLLAMIAVVFGIVALRSPVSRSLEQSQNAAEAIKQNRNDIIGPLQEARVTAFATWRVGNRDNDALSCIVRAFDQDPNYEGAGKKLSIFDKAMRLIYEDYFSDVHRIYSSNALRLDVPQLILEVDYGGSTSFLEILDYRNGKVEDLMQAVKPNNDFVLGAEVRPQFRSGVIPAAEPYQVLLTTGVGLASPAEKYTEVFRYKDGSYRYVGEFSTKEVDDYMEEHLKGTQTKPKRSK